MRTFFVFCSLACFSGLGLIACGGDTASQTDGGDEASTDDGGADVVVVDAGPDVDNGAVSTNYPAFKVDAPQVVTFGGPVLATPKVIPVYFSNDSTTFTDSVTTFLGKMAASTYWGPSVTEYGIGALSIGTPVQLVNEPAPTTIDDSAIQTWLAGKITDATLPAPDANTIYALYYPTGTTITLQGQSSCQSFGGYHNNIVTTAKQNVSYAVMPRCAKFGGLTGLDAVSATTSHEVIEAATDPYPASAGAYGQVDDNHIIWMFVLGGGETGDMCAQNQDSFYAPSDIGNYVQRTWSNASAKAGHNPCLPTTAGQPYFNSMPVLTDKLTLGGGQLTTKGVLIPVGQEKTIEVDLFSDAATGGAWVVSATDTATLQGQTPELQFTWDRTTGQNGEKLHLAIKVLKASQYNAEGFMITSRLGTRENLWVGTVGN